MLRRAPKLLAAVTTSLPATANLFLQTFRLPSPRRLLALLHHAPTDVDARHLLDGTPRRTRASSIVRALRDGSPLDADTIAALHCVSFNSGAVLDPTVCTSLLAAYARRGANVRAALALFDEAAEPDIILYIPPPTNNKNMFRNWANDIDKMTKVKIRIGVSPLYWYIFIITLFLTGPALTHGRIGQPPRAQAMGDPESQIFLY
jgi:hypothetical protein